MARSGLIAQRRKKRTSTMQMPSKRHLSIQTLWLEQAVRVLAVLVLILFVPAVCFAAPGSKAPDAAKVEAPSATTPPPSPVIAMADVATRAMEVTNLIRGFTAKFGSSTEMETIRQRLPGVSRMIDTQADVTKMMLEQMPSLAALQAQQQLWQGIQHQVTAWLNALTMRAGQLQEALTQLADLEKTWALTRTAAQASKAPGPVVQQIDATLSVLEAAQGRLQAQRAAVLNIQSSVADEAAGTENALAQIAKAQQTAVGGILTRDRPPIWSADLWAQARTSLPFRGREIAAACWEDISQYLFHPSRGLPLHAGIFVALALILCAARRRLDRWIADGAGASSAAMVFERPYTAALIGAMLAGAGTFSPAPPTVRLVLEVVALAPMIRLIRPMVHPLLIPGLYTVLVLFALDTVRQAFGDVVLIGQSILVLEALGGIVMLRLLHLSRLQRSPVEAAGSSRPRGMEVVSALVLLMLSVGLLAGLFGYMRLARLLVASVLAGGALALTLYAVLRVFGGAVAFALHVWPLRLLEMVKHHRILLERRIYRLMVWVAILAWLSRYLDYVGLLQPVLSLGSSILATRLDRGSISTSVGEILEFFLTVWAAYLLSGFIRFVLQEDVYPRIGVPKGMSYATSSLIHYVLLALGFVVGLAVLGVKLSQVSVLAGAFGVGIGFGLQSIVNNFVSGLILLFERPVHVGDTIELGDLLGKVRRIGIRASIVHTWQGADIIVPNSQLVSDQVTNWTLSDQLRRIDLQVGLNYSAAPQEVIRVLEAVAAAHPLVLKEPAPKALFVDYGDNSINFELRAWTDQFDKWPRIRSDLAVALYDAAHEAGMSFPFPQREVRLLNDAEGVSHPAFGPRGSLPPIPEPLESREEKPVRIEGRDTHKAKQPG
jgi:potassium-dependent mechanosensitive channel